MSAAEVQSWRLIVYSIAGLPSAIVALALIALLPPFYADEVGLGLAITGTMFLYGRLWDAFADLAMGGILDTVKLPGGFRRPWLLLSVPLLGGASWMLFMPPPNASALYLLVGLLLLNTGIALFSITHRVWVTEISDQPDGKLRGLGYLEFIYYGGFIGVSLVPIALAAFTKADMLAILGWSIVLMSMLFIPIAIFMLPDNGAPKAGQSMSDHFRAVASLRSVPSVWRLTATDLAVSIAVGTVSALIAFYGEHLLGDRNAGPFMLLATLVGVLLAVPIWGKLSKRFSKRQAIFIGMALSALAASALPFSPPAGKLICAIIFFAYGLGVGGAWFLIKACVPDVAAADQAATGQSRPSLLFGLIIFTNKAGLGLAVGLAYPLMAWLGFDAAASAGETPVIGLQVAIFVVPTLALAFGAWAIRGFDAEQRPIG
jgi:glycoside/pentoside/hexuronide:cation symporter, GPH family